jgi:hypothetical protein
LVAWEGMTEEAIRTQGAHEVRRKGRSFLVRVSAEVCENTGTL